MGSSLCKTALCNSGVADTAEVHFLAPPLNAFAPTVPLDAEAPHVKHCYGCLRPLPSKTGNDKDEGPDGLRVVCHPMWQEDLVCEHCSIYAPRCIVCERPSRGYSAPHLIVGRALGRESFFLCDVCSSTGIAETAADLHNLIQEVLDFFENDPALKLRISDHFLISTAGSAWDRARAATLGKALLHVHYSPIHALALPSDARACLSKGTLQAWSEELVFGKFHRPQRSRGAVPVYEIEICHRLQFDTAVAVLAHEVFHAFLDIRGVRLSIDWEEGLCNAVAVRNLLHRGRNITATFRQLDLRTCPRSGAPQRLRCPLVRLRIELCDFRRHRLSIGDTFGTRQLQRALLLFSANVNWREQLGIK